MQTETKINGNAPVWVRALKNKYESGIAQAFVLHFNVYDYVLPGVSLRAYLAQLHKSSEIVVVYSRAEGFEFVNASMEEKFKEVAEFNQTEANKDPILSALNESQGDAADELPRSPGSAIPLLTKALRAKRKGELPLITVIVDQAELIAPTAALGTMSPADRDLLAQITGWGSDQRITQAGNVVYLVTPVLGDLHEKITAASSRFETIEIGLPDTSARESALEEFLELPETTDKVVSWEAIGAMARLTAGMNLLQVEDVTLRAEAEGVNLDESDEIIPFIQERKADIFRSEFADVITVVDPEYGYERIGGHEIVKQFFTRSIIDPIREGNPARVPMGVLLTGPAGTGKSVMAEAVAFESDLNMINFNPAQIFGRYVGDSERNLEKALSAIESLAPCIVFIDEIDQAVDRQAGGNQVNARVFRRLLEFMSDGKHRGRVVFLAATNRPDLMDAALKRPGRFDKKIPFMPPTNDEERAELMALFSRLYLKNDWKGDDMPVGALSELDDSYTGAEIEAIVIKAMELTIDEGADHAGALVAASKRLRPTTESVEFMADLALLECNDLDLLPEKYHGRFKNRADVQEAVSSFQTAKRGRRNE